MDVPVAASAILNALADLAPSGEPRAGGRTIPLEWFRWLPLRAVSLLQPADGMVDVGMARMATIDARFGERLAAVDRIRPEEHSLRVGWLFVAGRQRDDDGNLRRVFHPLVSVPVRVVRSPLVGATLHPAGDVALTTLIQDHSAQRALESRIETGGGSLHDIGDIAVPGPFLARLDRLRGFAYEAARAAGLPAARIVPATHGPDHLLRADHLVIVAGVGVYAVHETTDMSRAGSLRAWATWRLDRWTAFHSMYLDPPGAPHDTAQDDDRRVESPFVLTPVQREAVRRSRAEPVTVISGAPGTGKSHTVAAIACDALARNERVLVAAKTEATVDALLELLERSPGPDPVVFGSSERREALATRLASGQLQAHPEEGVARARARFQVAVTRRDRLLATIVDRLRAEQLAGTGADEHDSARALAPLLFDPDADLARASALADDADAGDGGWLRRRRARRARRSLETLAGTPQGATLDDVVAAIAMARAARVWRDLVAEGGLELGERWSELLSTDDEVRRLLAAWLAADSRSPARINRTTLASLAALGTALRAGRAARREHLARLDDDKLTRAMPLWVGTLPDIDDLLPPVPGLFDLVVLDEASSIDQPLAAPALLRARRAVVVGDPRQLRHVSFLADDRLQAVLRSHGLDRDPVLAARLDARRNSAFDVAAGVSPVAVLNEHFRSDPHLVQFVAQRLYDGAVHVATRAPTTESVDCVRVLRLAGARNRQGVVEAEVARTIKELRALRKAGARGVGVVTPFRAQADAIEEAVLSTFSADDLDALDLRVGTVHAFQGNERDLVIVSLGIGPDDTASWRFVEDPHLFAVLATRARRRLLLLLSADPPPGGLAADYLAQADKPPGPPKSAADVDAWTAAIADDLGAGGLSVSTAYPTGRHLVDVCVGPDRAVAIECGVHPAGAEPHVERHLDLRRAGWTVLEAHRSRWGARRGELVVELLRVLASP